MTETRPRLGSIAVGGMRAALGCGVLEWGESVIKYPSPLNVLKDTYDHSCY